MVYFIGYIALIVANIVFGWNLPWWVFLLATLPIVIPIIIVVFVFVLGVVGLLEEDNRPSSRWRA